MESPGYNLICADNPSNTKWGGVCIYYHNSLPLKVIDIQFLNECINFEIRIGGKLCSFLCLYRSPSQTRDIFETFDDNFELTLDTISNRNSVFIAALGEFSEIIKSLFKLKSMLHYEYFFPHNSEQVKNFDEKSYKKLIIQRKISRDMLTDLVMIMT